MAQRYLTAQEVADLLKIKKSTVYEMIKKGALQAVKLGKQFRVSEDHVRSILNQPKQESSITAPLPTCTTNRFIICGQDSLLDLLCNNANSIYGEPFFLRSQLGSYNGLQAMYQGQANAATCHLWDVDTDTYNFPFISKLLPGERLHVYHIAKRMVGFYTAVGNPKNITNINDFTRSDICTVSREKGSGIRVLTDSLFLKNGILPDHVQGYETVVNSHLAAAAAVASEQADCAIGNQKAALQTPAVNFIPLRAEQYDIVFRANDIEHPAVHILLETLQSKEFCDSLNALGGYDTTNLGQRLI